MNASTNLSSNDSDSAKKSPDCNNAKGFKCSDDSNNTKNIKRSDDTNKSKGFRHAKDSIDSVNIQNSCPASSRVLAFGKRYQLWLIAAIAVLCIGIPVAAYAAGTGQGDESYTKTSDRSAAQAEPTNNSDGVTKTQVVYIDDDAQGNKQGIYVVNTFTTGHQTNVTDSGNYTSVQNLTDEQPLSNDASTFTVSDQNDFVYRGTMDTNTPAPWDIAATYQLNGQDIDPSQLAGQSGALTMTLTLAPNSECSIDYADNYLLQVTGKLKTATTHDIKAEGATQAQSGDDTQLSYMVFPGKTETYTITAQVEDFSFEGWTIVGVPLSIALDVDDGMFADATSELNTLSGAIAAVNHGVSNVSDGAQALDEGLSELTSRSQALNNGGESLTNSLGSLNQGATSLNDALNNNLVAGAEQLAQGSSAYVKGLEANSEAYSGAAKNIDVQSAQAAYTQALSTYTQTFSNAYTQAYLTYLQQLPPDTDPTSVVKEAAQAAASAALQSDAFISAKANLQDALTKLVSATATLNSNQAAADALQSALESYSNIDAGLQSMVDPHSESSVYALAQGSEVLASGTKAAQAGSQELQNGVEAYTQGTDTSAEGASTLADGTSTLSDGTQELADQTVGLDQKMIDTVRDKLQEFLNPDFSPVDFANNSVENISRVQFIYMTDAIAQNESNATDGHNSSEENSSSDDAQTNETHSNNQQQNQQGLLEKFIALFQK